MAEWLQAVGAALRELEEEGKIKPAVKGARKVASKAASQVASKTTVAGRRRQALAGGTTMWSTGSRTQPRRWAMPWWMP